MQPTIYAEDLTLHAAIERALRSSAAQVWQAEDEEARGAVRQAALGLNPRLYLQSEDLRPWDGNFSFVSNTEDYGYVGQTFELDGKRSHRVANAKAQLHQEQDYTLLRRRQLAARVSAAYWQAVLSERIVDLLRRDMRAVEDMIDYDHKRVDAGAMRGVDLIRIEIERDRLTVALRAAERDAAIARTDLQRELVEPLSADVHLTDRIDSAPAISPIQPEVAVAARLDLTVAQDAVYAAEAELRLQRANAVPNLDLLGGYKRNSGLDTAYGALQIDLPLRNRNQGQIDRARASLTAAQATLAAVRVRAEAEIEAARIYYEQQQALVNQTLPEMQSRAQHNLDIVSEAYRIGGVDLLRFLDAERTSFEIDLTALRTRAEYQQAAVRLQLAYGMEP